MSIQTVTIDFWNTIFDSSNGKARNAHRLRTLVEAIDKTGIYVSGDAINSALEASWANFEHFWTIKQRTPTTRETVDFIWHKLSLPNATDAVEFVENEFAQGVLIHSPKLIEGVEESLSLLSKEFKLSLISDTGFSPGTVLRDLMKRNNIYDYFSSFSFSDETGVSKPDSKAFFTALEPLATLPEFALHIGDIEHTDIKGAKALGMKAIRFNGDLTDFVSMRNTQTSQADREANSWTEVRNAIYDLSGK